MDQSTFDIFARRSAELLNRRSLFGGLSAALLAASSVPVAAEAKKKGKNRKSCKRRAKACRDEFLENCDDVDNTEGCIRDVNRCCKKAAKCKVTDLDKVFDCGIQALCRNGGEVGGVCD